MGSTRGEYSPIIFGEVVQRPRANYGGQTIVGVWQWAAYHSASNFHDWESFVPERWLPDAPAEYKGDKKDVLHPFSTGPRNCIGKECVPPPKTAPGYA